MDAFSRESGGIRSVAAIRVGAAGKSCGRVRPSRRSLPMLDDDEDLDQMSPERLRELKQEVLLRIEEIGSRDASVEPERADEIKELDDLLNEIEERLSGPETAAS